MSLLEVVASCYLLLLVMIMMLPPSFSPLPSIPRSHARRPACLAAPWLDLSLFLRDEVTIGIVLRDFQQTIKKKESKKDATQNMIFLQTKKKN